MGELNQLAVERPKAARAASSLRSRLLRLGTWALLCTLLFAIPLWEWASFSVKSTLYSHTILMPVLGLYLAWTTKPRWAAKAAGGGSPWLASVAVVCGASLVAAGWLGVESSWFIDRQNRVAVWVSSYVILLVAGVFGFLGQRAARSLAIPLLLVLMAAPFPQAVEGAIESFFQYTSAEAAAFLFGLTGAPVFREGLVFHLPGIVMEVAQECSGIRSTLVLFITSLAAGYLFLRSPVKRAVLVCLVVPLGIARNGVRIFTIGMLCIHVSPDMIHSWVHRKGGPLFFLASLVPFFLTLYYLHRSEQQPETARISPPPGGSDD